jgi:hypothetical protein
MNIRIPSIVFASAALIAISASQIVPAAAQGVPAGLLRLDSATPALDAQASLEVQQPKARAHVRKHNAAH